MKATNRRRAAIYARLSLTTDESVSIARQLDACRNYAEARGLEVVLEAVDDGVSATRLAPHQRPGWRRIVEAADDLDAVVIWKLDRLARSTLDLLNVDRVLAEHEVGLVAVEDPIDMTTPAGRAFSQVLSTLGELEAANTGARVRAARRHTLTHEPGRVVGGKRPWPYRAVPRADGSGKRWEPIPARAAAIRKAADDLIARRTSMHQVAKAWNKDHELQARGQGWTSGMIGDVLRNPVLYGATIARGPKRITGKGWQPAEVVREPDGTARIDPGRVILDLPTWSRLQKAITHPRKPAYTARGPWLLTRFLQCSGIDGAPHRTVLVVSASGRHPRYRCKVPDCYRSVLVAPADELITTQFLDAVGDWPVLAPSTLTEPVDPARVAGLREAVEATTTELIATVDPEQGAALVRRRAELQARLDAAQADTGVVALRPTGQTIREAWADGDDHARAELLEPWLDALWLHPARPGRRVPVEDRVTIEWSADFPAR